MRYEKLHLKEFYDFLGKDGADPTLELFLPYNMSEMHRENLMRPAILICPGGGYGMCSQRESEPIALQYTAGGYNVFLLTYSCAPHRFPTQLREVAAAMDLIALHAEEWNTDENRIAILGFSAGGHLAAHYSTAFDCPEVREVFPESRPVKASVLCYPVITCIPAYSHAGSFRNLLGREVTPEDDEKYSCDKLVGDRTPTAFLWTTSTDSLVPPINAMLYAQALIAHHIPCELHMYPFGRHGLATADDETNSPDLPAEERLAKAWIAESKRWLGQSL